MIIAGALSIPSFIENHLRSAFLYPTSVKLVKYCRNVFNKVLPMSLAGFCVNELLSFYQSDVDATRSFHST